MDTAGDIRTRIDVFWKWRFFILSLPMIVTFTGIWALHQKQATVFQARVEFELGFLESNGDKNPDESKFMVEQITEASIQEKAFAGIKGLVPGDITCQAEPIESVKNNRFVLICEGTGKEEVSSAVSEIMNAYTDRIRSMFPEAELFLITLPKQFLERTEFSATLSLIGEELNRLEKFVSNLKNGMKGIKKPKLEEDVIKSAAKLTEMRVYLYPKLMEEVNLRFEKGSFESHEYRVKMKNQDLNHQLGTLRKLEERLLLDKQGVVGSLTKEQSSAYATATMERLLAVRMNILSIESELERNRIKLSEIKEDKVIVISGIKAFSADLEKMADTINLSALGLQKTKQDDAVIINTDKRYAQRNRLNLKLMGVKLFVAAFVCTIAIAFFLEFLRQKVFRPEPE